MTANEIISNIDNGDISPVYFLYGEEDYFIDTISDYIEKNMLKEDEKSFNQMIIYGRDTSVEELITHAKRFPMMAERQVIIVKEAQDLAKSFEKFASYFENVQPTTTIVFNYKHKKPDKRKSVFKKLSKVGVLFEGKKLYENQVPTWINSYIKAKAFSIEPKATQMLVEFLGTDLHKIANELDKLMIVLPKGSAINAIDVEEHIGISKDFNNFELRKAIGVKNVVKANQIINYFAQNPKSNPVVVTLALLLSFFTQLLQYHALPNKNDPKKVAAALGVHPFFIQDYITAGKNYPMRKVSQVISYLRESDVKSKGVGARDLSDADLMKELLFKILH